MMLSWEVTLPQGHASSTNESSPLQQVNQSPVGPEEEEFGDGEFLQVLSFILSFILYRLT